MAGIATINPFELPLLNTILLLSSGATVTYAHHSVIEGNRRGAILGTLMTLIFAVLFTICQGIEYVNFMLDLLLQMEYSDQHSSSQQVSMVYM